VAPVGGRPPSIHACVWGGWGSSIVVIDLQAKLDVSYGLNRMAMALLGGTRGSDVLFAAAVGAAT
jgi:hypothetical protein